MTPKKKSRAGEFEGENMNAPDDAKWRIRAASILTAHNRRPSKKVKSNAFPDHRGRPGQVGGSLPRSAGSGPTPVYRPSAPARRLLEKLRGNPDGFSYDPVDESVPQSGYMSSVSDGPIFSPDIPEDEALEMIDAFLEEKRDLLADPDVYAGGWFNNEDGQFYLDASQNYQDELSTMQSASSTHQKSVFSLDKFEVVWVSDWLREHPDFEAPEGARDWYLKNPN